MVTNLEIACSVSLLSLLEGKLKVNSHIYRTGLRLCADWNETVSRRARTYTGLTETVSCRSHTYRTGLKVCRVASRTHIYTTGLRLCRVAHTYRTGLRHVLTGPRLCRVSHTLIQDWTDTVFWLDWDCHVVPIHKQGWTETVLCRTVAFMKVGAVAGKGPKAPILLGCPKDDEQRFPIFEYFEIRRLEISVGRSDCNES